MHVRLSGVAVAVAVHRQAVHHIDIQHIPIHIVGHRLPCFRHRFQESILIAAPHAAAGPAGMDVGLAVSGSNAYGDIFNRSAESCHGVPFKMGKTQ